MRIDEEVDERTQWELYMPPFIGSVEADVKSFMCRCSCTFDIGKFLLLTCTFVRLTSASNICIQATILYVCFSRLPPQIADLF